MLTERQIKGGCAIAVMAKASIPGRAKTRLVPPLTHDEAADLNTAFLRDVAANILAASEMADIRAWMAHAPAGSADFFRRHMPGGVGLIETVAPDFGACLRYAAGGLLDAGHAAVCLLNSDSPTLPVAYLVSAAVMLAAPGDRVVLGPSTDGGYYLIGMKRLHEGLFRDIDWSTERVFAQTLVRARDLGVPVWELPSWYDVDDAVALAKLGRELFAMEPFRACGTVTPARWSRTALRTLFDTAGLGNRFDAGFRAGLRERLAPPTPGVSQ